MSIRCQQIPATGDSTRLSTFTARIAILIPAYNEAPHLEELVRRCLATRPALIVVVDDCSTDGTAEVLARLEDEVGAAGGTRLVVLRNDTNRGKQGSVRRGLLWLSGEQLDGIALIDGDLQHDPTELPQLAELLRLYDVVIGARSHREMPWHRRLSNALVNGGFRLLAGVDFIDIQSGLRLYSKAIADTLGAMLEPEGGFALEHESLALLAQMSTESGVTLQVAAAPVTCAYAGETSHIGLPDIAQLAAETVRQGLRFRRANEALVG